MRKGKKCRWGFLSASWIGMKNWQSVALSGNGEIVAVASRERDKAAAWIEECADHVPFPSCPEAMEGYEALLAREDVDAVYIPLPTGMRKEWVVKAAEAGKHVLCEKPCGASVGEVEEMLAACRSAGVQFMDGVMFMHSGRLPALRRAMNDGASFGSLRHIRSQFSFCAGKEFLEGNIRMHSGLEPLGCLGDLGWYNIRFALWAMRYEMPLSVTGNMLQGAARADSPEPVPVEFSGEMFFGNGVSASFFCSFKVANQQWAHLCGTEGNLCLDDFVVPCYGSEVGFTVSRMASSQHVCDFNMERRERRVIAQEYSNSHPSAQETALFRNFAERVIRNDVDTEWGVIALKTQKVLMACLQSSRKGGLSVAL